MTIAKSEWIDCFVETLCDTSFVGLSESRLPAFTEQEKEEIAGTYDFFALNGYTSRYVSYKLKPIDEPSYENDRDTIEVRLHFFKAECLFCHKAVVASTLVSTFIHLERYFLSIASNATRRD